MATMIAPAMVESREVEPCGAGASRGEEAGGDGGWRGAGAQPTRLCLEDSVMARRRSVRSTYRRTAAASPLRGDMCGTSRWMKKWTSPSMSSRPSMGWS
eukprot:6388113-Prymnesium_polylepis.2